MSTYSVMRHEHQTWETPSEDEPVGPEYLLLDEARAYLARLEAAYPHRSYWIAEFDHGDFIREVEPA